MQSKGCQRSQSRLEVRNPTGTPGALFASCGPGPRDSCFKACRYKQRVCSGFGATPVSGVQGEMLTASSEPGSWCFRRETGTGSTGQRVWEGKGPFLRDGKQSTEQTRGTHSAYSPCSRLLCLALARRCFAVRVSVGEVAKQALPWGCVTSL